MVIYDKSLTIEDFTVIKDYGKIFSGMEKCS